MLLQNLRARMSARLKGEKGEAGFTLIELLVVMLILGILAAIAIPAFFNQREKANDAQAKSMVRSAQTAIETFFTDSGTYTGATPAGLKAIEETILIGGEGDAEDPNLTTVTPSEAGDAYTITVDSPVSENTFSIARSNAGIVTYTCTAETVAGCPAGGNWD